MTSSAGALSFGSAEVAAAQLPPKAMFFPASNGHPATACVVFLHGSGSSGAELEGYFDANVRAKLPYASWLFPTASPRPYMLLSGESWPVWYDRTSLGLDCREDRAGIGHSVAGVRALLAEHAAALSHSRILVGGFSQGGGLALYTAFAKDNTEAFAGCATSGAFLSEPTFLLDDQPASKDGEGAFPAALLSTPLLLVHGTRDQTVAYASGVNTFERLRTRAGLTHVEHFKREGMMHEMDEETRERLVAFFAQCLPESTKPQ
jgi:predicted esterase